MADAVSKMILYGNTTVTVLNQSSQVLNAVASQGSITVSTSSIQFMHDELSTIAQNITYHYTVGGQQVTTTNVTQVLLDLTKNVSSISVSYEIPDHDYMADAVSKMILYGNTTVTLPLGKLYGDIVIDDGVIAYKPTVSLLHNMTSYHSIPAGAASLTEAVYRRLLKNSSATFSVNSYPFPLTSRQSSTLNVVLAVFAALFILIPFCYLPASFTIFVVKERSVKATHIQLVSGASVNAYWIATYLWDITNYVFIIGCVEIVFLAFQNSSFVGTANKAWAVFMLFLLFGTSIIPLSYIYSLRFDNHSSAQVAISGIHFATGFVLTIVSYMADNMRGTARVNANLKKFYRLFPTFDLGEGLMQLTVSAFYEILYGSTTNAFSWDVCGRNMVYMFVETIVFFGALLVMENNYIKNIQWRKLLRECKERIQSCFTGARRYEFDERINVEDQKEPIPLPDEDADVFSERKRIEEMGGGSHKDILSIRSLRKVYPGLSGQTSTVAVQNLSLGVPEGECFGFLGVNGAGKTTTMSILTGDFPATSGAATIAGFDIKSQMAKVRQVIGYCPQFDPLIDLMTAREHLYFFAKLRGVPRERIQPVVEILLEKSGLSKFADKVSGSYSGGNKRKLSFCIALIGNPSVVFLDEPSSGMDPVSRRFMWNVINASKLGRSIILTTHSMEECEALCGRVGIMAAGRLQCLGSIQHLKSKFGRGYQIELKLKPKLDDSKEEVDAKERNRLAKAFFNDSFEGLSIEEEFPLLFKMQLPNEGHTLASIFRTIEESRKQIGIDDYAISQSTLEQVFISIAKRDGKPPPDQ
eukprot:TRINITY_DN13418_c0_g1_i1.p1 TRINITY_DN13418_c0_g1~~TRINITY_DN13418_c0_g1_i1.p1  ORF type:complete len:835 (+),score=191.20 TRINITY_DN13418_c0_g1_i1:75-2507(+)